MLSLLLVFLVLLMLLMLSMPAVQDEWESADSALADDASAPPQDAVSPASAHLQPGFLLLQRLLLPAAGPASAVPVGAAGSRSLQRL